MQVNLRIYYGTFEKYVPTNFSARHKFTFSCLWKLKLERKCPGLATFIGYLAGIFCQFCQAIRKLTPFSKTFVYPLLTKIRVLRTMYYVFAWNYGSTVSVSRTYFFNALSNIFRPIKTGFPPKFSKLHRKYLHVLYVLCRSSCRSLEKAVSPRWSYWSTERRAKPALWKKSTLTTIRIR